MHKKDGRARKRTGKTPPKYIDGTMQCSKHPLIEVMWADLNFSANKKMPLNIVGLCPQMCTMKAKH